MRGALETVVRQANKAQALRKKNKNLSAAFIMGLLLAAVSAKYGRPTPIGFFLGLLAGVVYANGFEYFTHRYILHERDGFFCLQHKKHHEKLHSPDAPDYVLFSRNPLGVVALFCINAVPFWATEWIFHSGWASGVFVSFALYYMAFEELHWRSHMGGRLPFWLKSTARYHLRHHADHTTRFNVFLPMFDWLALLGSSGHSRESQNAKPEFKSPDFMRSARPALDLDKLKHLF